MRSQDLEELGLEACLVQLVAGWKRGSRPRAVVHLDLMGDLAGVPQAVSTSVYRIAQECLTNAMRHGRPSDVHLRVERLASNEGVVALTSRMTAAAIPASSTPRPAMAFWACGRRVSAFGGSLSIGRAAHGVRVAARIPLLRRMRRSTRELAAA